MAFDFFDLMLLEQGIGGLLGIVGFFVVGGLGRRVGWDVGLRLLREGVGALTLGGGDGLFALGGPTDGAVVGTAAKGQRRPGGGANSDCTK